MSSGGHSGQVFVFGVPSMRLLKVIPVFTPDAWQGYGYGSDQGNVVLGEGSDPAKSNPLAWGDTHHPALSETEGDYDGRFLYINDRANGRIGMVDLRDFKTKQIYDVPEHPDVPRWVLRHAEQRVRPHLLDVAVPRDRKRLRAPLPLQGGLPGVLDVARDRPGHRTVPAGQELPDRAASVHAGPGGRGQAHELRVRLHQLLQHGDGHRRRPARRAHGSLHGPGGNGDQERLRLPAHHRLAEGRGVLPGRIRTEEAERDARDPARRPR